MFQDFKQIGWKLAPTAHSKATKNDSESFCIFHYIVLTPLDTVEIEIFQSYEKPDRHLLFAPCLFLFAFCSLLRVFAFLLFSHCPCVTLRI